MTSSGARFPGAEGIPSGLGAVFGPNHVPDRVFIEFIAAIGLLEMGYTSRQVINCNPLPRCARHIPRKIYRFYISHILIRSG